MLRCCMVLAWVIFTQGVANAFPVLTAEKFLGLSEPAQFRFVTGYQTFVVQLQSDAGHVETFVDGDYALHNFPRWSLISEAWAAESVCAPIGQKTCVIAGNLSEMRERTKKNDQGEEVCAGYACTKSGFTQGCGRSEVRCNPLLFVNDEGKSFCVSTSSPLGVTKMCQLKTDRKELLYMLKKKLSTADGKAEFESFQSRAKAYCKNPHGSDRNSKSGFGACDVLDSLFLDLGFDLGNEAELDQKYQKSEKTVCLFETPNGISKITVQRNAAGNITSAQMYQYGRGQGRYLSGWIPSSGVEFTGGSKAADGRQSLNFKFKGLPPYPKLNGALRTQNFTYSLDKHEPGTCSFTGLANGPKDLRFPLKSLRDPNLAKSLDVPSYLGEMDRILGEPQSREREYTKKISEAVALVKSRKGCRSTSQSGLGGPLVALAPGDTETRLWLNDVREGRKFDKVLHATNLTCKCDWFTADPVEIAGNLTEKDTGKSFFMEVQRKFCSQGTGQQGGQNGQGL